MTSPRRKLKRFEGQNDARYLTFSCYQRLPLLNNVAIKNLFIAQMVHVQRAMKFEIYAWVIMPEHVHLLVMPKPMVIRHTPPCGTECGTQTATSDSTPTVEQITHRLKSAFAQRVIHRWRELNAPILNRIVDTHGRAHFWQTGGGYDRNIFSHNELQEKIDYIHANPIRRELANRVQDYHWSSIHTYIGLPKNNHPVITKPI